MIVIWPNLQVYVEVKIAKLVSQTNIGVNTMIPYSCWNVRYDHLTFVECNLAMYLPNESAKMYYRILQFSP